MSDLRESDRPAVSALRVAGRRWTHTRRLSATSVTHATGRGSWRAGGGCLGAFDGARDGGVLRPTSAMVAELKRLLSDRRRAAGAVGVAVVERRARREDCPCCGWRRVCASTRCEKLCERRSVPAWPLRRNNQDGPNEVFMEKSLAG